MILTGSEIEKQISSEKIHISPFSKSQVNPNSYNFRLSPHILELVDHHIDPVAKSDWRKVEIPEEGYLLLPRHLYLGCTLEEIGSNDYVTTLMGRSSLGRLGLFLQITADLGQLGTRQSWTLELTVVQPVVVYPRMVIGQVCFWKIDGNSDSLYNGKYHRDFLPQCSKLYQELVPHDPNREKNSRERPGEKNHHRSVFS
jgi:dCTP deaminase